MKTTRFLAALLVVAMAATAAAQSGQSRIADFNFEGADYTNSASSAFANVSDMSSPANNMFAGGRWCTLSSWATTTPQGPFNNSPYYLEFVVSPVGGQPVQLTELVIESWRGGGRRDVIEFVGVYIDEDPGPGGDNFQTLVATADVFPQSTGGATVSIDLTGFSPLMELVADTTVRLYFWGDGNSGTSNAEFDRISLFGAQGPSLIGDFVWMDADCDGLQGGLEMGLMGVTVNLIAADGVTVLDSAVTGMNGAYSFEVMPGTYFVEFVYNSTLVRPTSPGVGSDPTRDSNLDPATNRTGPIVVGPGVNRDDIDAGFCAVCVGPPAFLNQSLGGCGLAIEPVLNASRPILGSILDLNISGPLPDAEVFVFGDLAPPTRSAFFTGITTCEVWVDLNTFLLFFRGRTDANGDWGLMLPLPADPSVIGLDVTLQARVCLPGTPGPIPGFPDWLTNGVHLKFGCP